MNHSDEMSDLSLQEEGQKEFSPASATVRRRFYCKVFGCSKSYSHSSSLYRHVGSAHPLFVSFRREETTLLNRFEFAGNHHSMQEETQSLRHQMISAGHGALFAKFNSLLELIPRAEPVAIDHLQRFDTILHKALFSSVEGASADMDVVRDEDEHLSGHSSASSSHEDVITLDNNELCSAHILGFSSDSTLAEQYAIDLFDAGSNP